MELKKERGCDCSAGSDSQYESTQLYFTTDRHRASRQDDGE